MAQGRNGKYILCALGTSRDAQHINNLTQSFSEKSLPILPSTLYFS